MAEVDVPLVLAAIDRDEFRVDSDAVRRAAAAAVELTAGVMPLPVAVPAAGRGDGFSKSAS